jgi:aryl-alcohol dehydrogenase-like predicted oxidoreductase
MRYVDFRDSIGKELRRSDGRDEKTDFCARPPRIAPMNKTAFGRTGLMVAPLGFGAAPIGFLKTDQDRVASMLNFMLDAGANVIDTAAMYEGSEELIGRAVGHRRSEYVLVSKCGTKVPDIDAPIWSAELVSKTVDRALKRLRTDHLDVMLLHSCDLETLKKGDALGALVKARDAGKIRHAGYSGDNETVAYAAALPDVAVIETSINIADQRNIDVALPVARQHNVGMIAKRPIANAAWKEPSQQPGMYKSYASTYTDRLKQMKLDPKALGFAGETGWPELALRFTLSQPGVHTAIIGTTNPDNARLNLSIAEKGALPADTVEKIRAAFRVADPSGSWTGEQ